jgi:hypothetical protein
MIQLLDGMVEIAISVMPRGVCMCVEQLGMLARVRAWCVACYVRSMGYQVFFLPWPGMVAAG